MDPALSRDPTRRGSLGGYSTAVALPGLLLKLVDAGTVVIELAPLVALFSPRLARRIPFALAAFHLGVLAAMGIDFSFNLQLYTLFAAHPRFGNRFSAISAKGSPISWMAALGTAAVAWRWGVVPAVDALDEAGWPSAIPMFWIFVVNAALLSWSTRPPRRHPGQAGVPIGESGGSRAPGETSAAVEEVSLRASQQGVGVTRSRG